MGKAQPSQLKNCKDYFEKVNSETEEAYTKYTALRKERDLAHLKLLYVEASSEGLSLERARGRADSYFLKPEELEDMDTEIKEIITNFFE